ncbi:11836_t:CDS:2 [Dentiscutata heterogama]|uniref:11836_t:CDS:1 n=1 Tax=Dentiscutata heterogama TaxID=1316150 RepID=A0ACA9N0C9_9GLOM|nr:11836_t:CDS:2 [Dentiscutata heterogama]
MPDNNELTSHVKGENFEYEVYEVIKTKFANLGKVTIHTITGGTMVYDNTTGLMSRSGKYTCIGDNGVDITLLYEKRFIIFQCKYRTPCPKCITNKIQCEHCYYKTTFADTMTTDVEKFNNTLNEWSNNTIGFFVVNDEVKIPNEYKANTEHKLLKLSNLSQLAERLQKEIIESKIITFTIQEIKYDIISDIVNNNNIGNTLE